MTIYEHNFSRLVTLLPGVRQLSGQLTALGRQQRCLAVEVVEHYKYTTVLRLAQNLPIPLPAAGLSHMTVCIYHDAQVAEVLAYQNCSRFRAKYDYPNPKMMQVREKRRVNEFLGEWLDYCLAQDMRFRLVPQYLGA